MTIFDDRAQAAVERYNYLLVIFRSQVDSVLRQNALSAEVRDEAIANARDAASRYLTMEQGILDEDSKEVLKRGWEDGLAGSGVKPYPLEDRHAEFLFEGAAAVSWSLGAQVSKDIATLRQHILSIAQRVDFYTRAPGYNEFRAIATVAEEEKTSPAFRYVDRLGRRYKSSKHIRDTYRQHLLNTYNEGVIDAVVTSGGNIVKVYHPDGNYKWAGEELCITPQRDIPLYYDVREEIFHPSSSAVLSL